jgi:hypothetical protein
MFTLAGRSASGAFMAVAVAITLGGCMVTAPTKVGDYSYDRLEEIGAISASKSCRFLRDSYENGKSLTKLAIAGDRAACLSVAASLEQKHAKKEGEQLPENEAINQIKSASATLVAGSSSSDTIAEGIDCNFDRYVNGPEIFWGAHLGDSPDAFFCALMNAGFKASENTVLCLEPGAARMTGFLDEIHGWRMESYNFGALEHQETTFHEINERSFKPYLEASWNKSSITWDIYRDFKVDNGAPTDERWSEWAKYLQDYYVAENEKMGYRQILFLPDIDPEYPEVYWAENQCSNVTVSNLPVGNTVWRLQADFKYVENGIPLLVDRIRAGEKQHYFGVIDGKPVYSSCMLRVLAFRSSDHDTVSKQKLTGVYDPLKSKLETLFPNVMNSSKARVGDIGSRFSINDGIIVTFAVDEYQGKPYPAAIVFEYTPQALDKIDQRGAEKLAEMDADADIVL